MLETSCDSTIRIPPYKFSYFSEAVPRKLSFGVDHWGYANGQTGNNGLVPTFYEIVNGGDSTHAGANRDAVWPAMRGGSLNQITYPTGGSTTFDFEPKNIYTFTNSVLEDVTLTSLVDHIYGQGNITQTLPFTLTGTGQCTILINNSSTNWSPTLIIQDVNNNTVYNSGLINFSSQYTTSISLAAGTYNATLSFPSNSQSTLINGAYANIGQWQYVPTQTTQTVSGLRIKTITNNDGMTNNNVVTSYTYTGGGNSTTAILYSIPVYAQVVRNNVRATVFPTDCSPNGCATCDNVYLVFENILGHGYLVSPGSIMPMSSLQGENVGYSEVDVSQTGNGHSAYRYYGITSQGTNITDVCQRTIYQSGLCDANIPNWPYAPVPFDFMRGELQYEGHYNQNGQVLKETYYNPLYVQDSLTTPGLITQQVPTLVSYTEYQLQSAYKIQDKTITNEYDPVNNNSITTTHTTYYGSNYHHEPTRKVTFTSTGDSLVSNIKYSFDFRIPSCDAIPDSLRYYFQRVNRDTVYYDSLIAICTPQGVGVTDANNCRNSLWQQFREQKAQDRVNYIWNRRRNFAADSANNRNSCILTAMNSADTLLRPILRLQNEFWNAAIETSSFKDLNLLHASYSRYDSSTSPIGFVYPGRTQLINLQAPSASFANATVSGNTVTRDNRYLDESFYKFYNGNPVQVIGHDGIVTSYLWDYKNTKPIAKTISTYIDSIAYTSFEADGSGNWTIPSSARDNTTSMSGSYSYNLSNGAVSKANLIGSNQYIVSYWSKNGQYSVTGSVSVQQGKTINGWTYYEHTVSHTTSISVSGTGDIDELRLYPTSSQMTTYTYNPLVGMSSSCDVDNRISYYYYDSLGRLKYIKDQDGNILKTYQYHYANQNPLSQ
jgi:hypothetical protein